MNLEFDPGEGWREIDVVTPESSYDLAQFDPQGVLARAWTRHQPMPLLPTEAYTVIRVTWKNARRAQAVLLRSGKEDKWSGMGYSYDTPHLAADITAFEVLAEPVKPGEQGWLEMFAEQEARVRRETAKAVLDLVRYGLKKHGNVDPEDLYQIGRIRFGLDA